MREFWYGIIRFIFNRITYTWLGMEVIGEENIPKSDGVIMAANHASYFDPPLVGTAMRKRVIHFMAKEELFHNPIMGWFLRYVQTFPVHRGRVDRKAVIEALRVLKSGAVLGIFPEGTSRDQGKLGKFHEGMAAIAIRAQVPVLPTAVINSRHLPKKSGPVRVVFGEPVQPPAFPAHDKEKEKELIRAFTEEIHSRILALINQHGGENMS